MKIVHILNYSWENGGSSKVVHDIAQRQQEEGFEVSIYSIDKVGQKPYLSIPGVEILLLKPHFLAKFLPLFSIELFKKLRNSNFDIIHLHGIWNFSLLAAYLLGLSEKCMLTIHGCLNPFTFKGTKFKRAIFTYSFQKRFMKKVKLIHVFHDMEKKYVENYLGTHPDIQVLANGIEIKPNFIANKERLRTGNVLFLSRLDPIKGLDLLLPAFLKVLKKKPNAVLQIAGPDFGMLAYVVQFIKIHNVSESIKYMGVLTGNQKQDAQNKANMFVLPSYSEGFSIAVLEALNEGIPVLVSYETGLSKEIIEANAGKVAKFDVDDIAECILQTLNSPENAYLQVQNAQNMIKEKFDIKLILNKMIEMNGQFGLK